MAFATHYEPEGVRLFELHDDVLKALKAGDTYVPAFSAPCCGH